MTGNLSNWSLDSLTARLEKGETLIYFEHPFIKFFDNDRVSSQLKADTGFLDMIEKNAELVTNVRVVSKTEAMTLETSKLFFSSAKNKIWTEEDVVIHKGGSVTRGHGFTANPDLSEIEITRQETVVTQPADIKGRREKKNGARRG